MKILGVKPAFFRPPVGSFTLYFLLPGKPELTWLNIAVRSLESSARRYHHQLGLPRCDRFVFSLSFETPLSLTPSAQVVTWDFDSGDSAGVSPNDQISRYNGLLSHYPTPAMSLNHETYASSVNVVAPDVIPKLVAKGYKVRVDSGR